MKRTIALFLIITLLFSLISCDTTDKNDKEQDGETVKITLKVDEHCTVLGDSVIEVAKGSDAEFTVKFDDGYEVASLTYGDFKNGTVIVKNCKKDRTINLYSQLSGEKDGMIKLEVYQNDNSYGSISSTHTGYVSENTEVTVTATAASEKIFLCWTKNRSLENGGEQISYNTEYTFTIEEKTIIFANFLCNDEKAVIYHLGGGVTSNQSDSVNSGLEKYIELYSEDKLCVNLAADTGLFINDGHTLLEYTLFSDKSGDAVNPGGLTKFSTQILNVYAKWAEWSDKSNFVYTRTTNGLAITGYNANEETLVIPAKIDGVAVTKITSGAFISRSFSTLVIPSSIKTMESGAFRNCNAFDTLYITDSFTAISDSAFTGCKSFSNLRLNAAISPHYATSPESMTARLEVLLTRDTTKPIMLVVGGSNVLHGFKAEEMERLLNYEYQVLNCGSNASGLGILYMEAFSCFLNSGDVIINAPEYATNQMGGTSFVWRTFRATECCYNIFRYVDFSKYSGFFDAMTAFNSAEARNGKGGAGYGKSPEDLKAVYCDYAKITSNAGTFSPFTVGADSINSQRAAVINDLYSSLASKGIKYYFSFAPIYSANGAPSVQSITALRESCEALLDCPIISTPEDYLFTSESYYDSNYHLTTASAKTRTEKLYNDFIAQINKEN